MKLAKDKLVFVVLFGFFMGTLFSPIPSFPFLGKLSSKITKAAKESMNIYSELKKDVKNLTKDKDNLTKDVDKLKAIPGQLLAAVNKIKTTLVGVKDHVVDTAKHVKETGDDVGKITKVYKALK